MREAMLNLPRLLSDFTAVAGRIKQDYEDFVVEELPLYPASGAGAHTYFLLEKRGLSTSQAVHDIARALGVRRRDIGYAGLKDAHAVTRQWMSVEHAEPEQVAAISLPRMRIVEVTRHTNKIKLGHLAANRFNIRVRQTEPDRLGELRAALQVLCRRGVPNYFGPQRFGGRGDTWQVGRAIIAGRLDEVVDLVLGRPSECDHGHILRARRLYEEKHYAAAARQWPGVFHDERQALWALERTGRKKVAFGAIDRSSRRFYVSAYQSHLFNQIVARRLADGLDRLHSGDLAWVHASGAVFLVEDAAVEQPRADTFAISPSGPLFGYRMTQATGWPGELEAELLVQERLTPQAFRDNPLHVKGNRRPLRFRPHDASIDLAADGRGPYLGFTFTLPRGCYATAMLRELFASPTAEGDGPRQGAAEDPSGDG